MTTVSDENSLQSFGPGWDPWDAPLEGEEAALYLAVQCGDVAAVRQALDQGASGAIFEPWEWCTALSKAVQQRTMDEVIPWLLKDGADPWHGDRYGFNAVDHAIANGNLPVLRQMLERSTPAQLQAALSQMVFMAARSGSPAMLDYVFDLGGSWETKNKDGKTLVDAGVLHELLAVGLHIPTTDPDGYPDDHAPGIHERLAQEAAMVAAIERRALHKVFPLGSTSPSMVPRVRTRL